MAWLRDFFSLLLLFSVITFAYYKFPVNIDVDISIEISQQFNFSRRMELKKLPDDDTSEGRIVVTLQVRWENSAYKNTTEHKKMADEETYIFRFKKRIEWQNDQVKERILFTVHVKWEDIRNSNVEECPQPVLLETCPLKEIPDPNTK